MPTCSHMYLYRTPHNNKESFLSLESSHNQNHNVHLIRSIPGVHISQIPRLGSSSVAVYLSLGSTPIAICMRIGASSIFARALVPRPLSP